MYAQYCIFRYEILNFRFFLKSASGELVQDSGISVEKPILFLLWAATEGLDRVDLLGDCLKRCFYILDDRPEMQKKSRTIFFIMEKFYFENIFRKKKFEKNSKIFFEIFYFFG